MDLRFERKVKQNTKKYGIIIIPKKMRKELENVPEGAILKVLISIEY